MAPLDLPGAEEGGEKARKCKDECSFAAAVALSLHQIGEVICRQGPCRFVSLLGDLPCCLITLPEACEATAECAKHREVF